MLPVACCPVCAGQTLKPDVLLYCTAPANEAAAYASDADGEIGAPLACPHTPQCS